MMTMLKVKRIDAAPQIPVLNPGDVQAPLIQAKVAGAPRRLHGRPRPKEVGRDLLCLAAAVLFRESQVYRDQGPSQSRDQFQNLGRDPVLRALFQARAKLECKRM